MGSITGVFQRNKVKTSLPQQPRCCRQHIFWGSRAEVKGCIGVDNTVILFQLITAESLKHGRWLHTKAQTDFDENLMCWEARRDPQFIIKIYQQPEAEKKKEGRSPTGLWSESSIPKLSRCYNNPYMVHTTLRELWLWAVEDIILTFHWLTDITQHSLLKIHEIL